MSRGRRAVVAALALFALVLAAGVAIARAKPVPPARLQVVAEEFSFSLSRQWIKEGQAVIELANFGEDGHDLRMRRLPAGKTIYKTPEIHPGRAGYIRAKLSAGRFVLWCSIANHRAEGMEANLTVKKAPKPKRPN